MCFYDLQKAFDSVEFPVLLKRLFDVGVNSKTWYMLYSWYVNFKALYAWDSIYLHPLPSVVVCDKVPSCHQLCSYWLWTHF